MTGSGADDRAAEHGTITLWILGLCLMLFLLGGISLDLWRSFSERRALAATADAAALAGASAGPASTGSWSCCWPTGYPRAGGTPGRSCPPEPSY